MGTKSQKVGKPSIIADELSTQALARYCPDLENWAKSWRIDDSDLAAGRRIVEFFKPFLLHLLTRGLSAKTLHRHRDHLWMLGGEVIRRRREDVHRRRLPVEQVTFALLEDDAGPLIWPRIAEREQRSFDSTCGKFHRFLTSSQTDDE